MAVIKESTKVTEQSKDQKGRPEGSGAGGPGRERRSRHRVRDDQQSGEGSLSALSKFKMLQRQRAALQPGPQEE